MTETAPTQANRSGGAAWSFGPVAISGPGVDRAGMEARLPPRRLLTCAAALVLLAVLASGCGGGSGDAHAATKKDPPAVQYTSQDLSFTHPAAWVAYANRWHPPVLHFHPLVYLSTQPIHSPCSTHGNATTCGLPVDHLQPGGVLAYWEFNELPIPGPIKLTGKQVRVDGHPAGFEDAAGGACRRIGADRTVEATVELGKDSLISLTACLRGPGLAQSEKSLDALLASTKFLPQ